MSWDWSGATAYGSMGANLGSNFGTIGTVAGGVLGAVAGGLTGSGVKPPPASPLQYYGQSEWDWYKNNVVPLQMQTIDSVYGPQSMRRAIDQATTSVNDQFAAVPGEFKRYASGLGASVTPAQQASVDKSTALQKGLYMAGAQNAARQNVTAARSALSGV